jgi:hypothetical protein
VTVTAPPATEPWKAFHEILKKFLKLIQDQVSKDIFIATWDKESDELEKIIKKPRDLPEGAAKNRKHFANYFSCYLNPRQGKESTLYLKVRFITAALRIRKNWTLPSTSSAKNYPKALRKRSPRSSCLGIPTLANRSNPNVSVVFLALQNPPTVRR